MAKDSSTSNSETSANRAFPLAAVLALFCIALSEGVFLAKTDPLTGVPFLAPQADDATIIVKRELLANTAEAIVVAGDSSCMMGLKPELIEAAISVPTINLGTLSSHTTHGFADMIADACLQPVKPKLVVMAVLPQSLEVNEARAREFKLLSRYLVAYGKQDDTFPLTLSQRWDWFVHKHEFNTFPSEFGGSLAQYRKSLEATNGWYPEKSEYTQAESVRKIFAPTEFSKLGIARAVTVAEENGVPLVFWWSPYPQDAVAPEFVEAVRDWTAKLQTLHPKLIIPRTTVPQWRPSRFGSVTHTNSTGATENSTELAEALRGLIK